MLSHLPSAPPTAAAVFLGDQKPTRFGGVYMSPNTETTASAPCCCNHPLYPTETIPVPPGCSAGRGALVRPSLSAVPRLPAGPAETAALQPQPGSALQDARLGV